MQLHSAEGEGGGGQDKAKAQNPVPAARSFILAGGGC